MLASTLFAAALTLSPVAQASAAWPDVNEPISTRSEPARNDAALVIGIEDYAFIPDIPGAGLNARSWVSWLSEHRKVGMVKPLLDNDATAEAMLQEAKRVAAQVGPGGRMWIIYIGHGAPGEKKAGSQLAEPVLVAVDAQQTAASLQSRAVSRDKLLEVVETILPADADVVMVQDACFSGKSGGGDELVPGLAPVKVIDATIGGRTTVLAAASNDQYAGPLNDMSRPAFSYLVLGALRGWGDDNTDGDVSSEEAVRYANKALLNTVNGRSQTAQREGKDVVLSRSGKESGPDLAKMALIKPGPIGGGGTGGGSTLGKRQIRTITYAGSGLVGLAGGAALVQGLFQQQAWQQDTQDGTITGREATEARDSVNQTLITGYSLVGVGVAGLVTGRIAFTGAAGPQGLRIGLTGTF